MEITVGLFLLLLFLAFLCEFIDASLGMGYGTILAPVLLIIGFDPIVAIPAVLISQAFGGFCASVFHHQFENVSFNMDSPDFRLALVIGGLGILATIAAALISLRLPGYLLKTYIGLLVLTMGVLLLRNRRFEFSWKKMVGIGILSAFNKGISGGGFGPVVTGGQILAGQNHKTAIGVTTLAEAPICISGFFTYLIARTVHEINEPILAMPLASFFKKMFAPGMFQWELIVALLLGSVLVAPFGAFTTKMLASNKLHYLVGALIAILGAWTLVKAWI